jgi:hypothetical protein
VDWSAFPPFFTDSEWHDQYGLLVAAVPAGDTVLAGQGSVSIATAHREETSLGNTDDWGMAMDSVGGLPGPVEGVNSVALQVRFSTLGNCFPVSVALTIDLLVLRTSLIPATAAPYGQRPKPNRFGGLPSDAIKAVDDNRLKLIDDLQHVNHLAGKIKNLLLQMEETSDDLMKSALRSAQPVASPRRATVGLSFSSIRTMRLISGWNGNIMTTPPPLRSAESPSQGAPSHTKLGRRRTPPN